MLFLEKEHLKWKSTYRLRTRLSATRFSGRRSITSSTKPNSLASSGDMKWSLSILDSAVCNKERQSSQAKTHPIHMSFSYIDIYKCENIRFSLDLQIDIHILWHIFHVQKLSHAIICLQPQIEQRQMAVTDFIRPEAMSSSSTIVSDEHVLETPTSI